MSEKINGADLNQVIRNLNEKVDAVYRHGALQEEYSTQTRDYGSGYCMTEVEAHTLGYICDHGETTVTHLAAYTRRTKGTVSKMLKKLEEKGLIARTQKQGNKKWVFFAPTQEGVKVNELHNSFDRIKTIEMLEALLEECTLEEVEGFYKVTALRVKFLEKKLGKNQSDGEPGDENRGEEY